jgi:hypothetical protein
MKQTCYGKLITVILWTCYLIFAHVLQTDHPFLSHTTKKHEKRSATAMHRWTQTLSQYKNWIIGLCLQEVASARPSQPFWGFQPYR